MTANPFNLLQLADGDDPSSLLAAAAQKQQKASAAPSPPASRLPTKPPPPQQQQIARDARNNEAPRRGGLGRGMAARGRGGRGQYRGYGDEEANGYTDHYTGGVRGDSGQVLDAEKKEGAGGYGGPRPSRGRGGYTTGDAVGDMGRPRRAFERHSGTGRGYELKRDGAGRGNWGTLDDDVISQVKNDSANSDEKVPASEAKKEPGNGLVSDDSKDKENPENEQDKEEEKEMTLEEYEKVLEEKRKTLFLILMKGEERKVEVDKDLKSMKQLSTKKDTHEVFIKLGSDKDATKRKENEKEERAKKSVSIYDLLKPAEGGRYNGQGARGRGRGSFRGGYGGRVPTSRDADAPSIEDRGHFPTLGAK